MSYHFPSIVAGTASNRTTTSWPVMMCYRICDQLPSTPTLLTASNVLLVAVFILLAFITRAGYRFFLHPLHIYPGPFLASISNIWKRYHHLRGNLHLVEHDLHQKYGYIVRTGPDSLSFSTQEAFKSICGPQPLAFSTETIDGLKRGFETVDSYTFVPEPVDGPSTILSARTYAEYGECTGLLRSFSPQVVKHVQHFLDKLAAANADAGGSIFSIAEPVHDLTINALAELIYGPSLYIFGPSLPISGPWTATLRGEGVLLAFRTAWKSILQASHAAYSAWLTTTGPVIRSTLWQNVKALDAGTKLLLFLKSPMAAVVQPSIATTADTSLNILDTKSAKAQSSHNSSTLAQNGSVSSTLEWTLGTSGAGTNLVWVAHEPIQVTEVAQPSIATTVDTSLNVFPTTSAIAQSLNTLAHNRSELTSRPVIRRTHAQTLEAKLEALATQTKWLLLEDPSQVTEVAQPSIAKSMLMMEREDLGIMEPEEISKECYNLLFAGLGSTAAVVTEVLEKLGSNEGIQWQEKIRSELERVKHPTKSKVLQAVVRESMRYSVPFPTAFPREVRPGAENMIAGLRTPLPVGTIVDAKSWIVKRDLRGNDAQEWKPERWLKTEWKEVEFVIFSKGPRGCIRRDIAMLIVILHAVAGVVSKWRIESAREMKGSSWLGRQNGRCGLKLTEIVSQNPYGDGDRRLEGGGKGSRLVCWGCRIGGAVLS